MAINPYDYMPQPSAGVLLEPCARDGADFAGVTAVVIDAIRATTTIVAALAAGAREVVPFATADEVRAEAARRPAGSYVTCGERLGERIEDLDLNNSPPAMTAGTVGERSLLLTTTNGTRAILDALEADEVLVAAMTNRSAVVRRAVAPGRRIAFVTAGTVGTVAAEDVLVAGACLEAMAGAPGGEGYHLEDSARLALAAWRDARDCLPETFRGTWGGAFITGLGLDEDLSACCAVDTTDVVPVVRGRPPVVTAG
jgi:2-phosphosulfolactate phosphatase